MTRLVAALGVALVGGAVLAIPASDNFNRANGAMGSNWIQQTPTVFQINTNQIESSSSSAAFADFACAYWNPTTDAFPANQSSQVTLANQASDSVGVVTVRISGTFAGGTFSGYMLNLRGAFAGTSDIEADLNNNGTVILDLSAVTFVTGDVVKLTASGSTITAYQNGVSIGSVVDTTVATGQPGVCIYGYTFGERLDDWIGDTLGGGTPPGTSGRFLLLGVGHHP